VEILKNTTEAASGRRGKGLWSVNISDKDRGVAGAARGSVVVGGDFSEYDLDGLPSAKGGHGGRPGE
jgi:hypothetical protein